MNIDFGIRVHVPRHPKLLFRNTIHHNAVPINFELIDFHCTIDSLEGHSIGNCGCVLMPHPDFQAIVHLLINRLLIIWKLNN